LITLKHESFVAYFTSGATPCPACGERLDWWKETRNDFARTFPEWQMAALIGAHVSARRLELHPEQSALIDLRELGIPPDAEILNVYLDTTVRGEPPHTLPALMVDTQLRFDPFPPTVILYGAAHGAETRSATQDVFITWVAPGVNEVSAHNLVDAARQYGAGRYHALVVPANVAVESALSQAATLAVRGFAKQEGDQVFLGGGRHVLVPAECPRTDALPHDRRAPAA
jgi:hypothetical protein